MKQLFLILTLSLITGFSIEAQRLAYVDVERILDAVPEYQQAQQTLDQLAAKWKQEISSEYTKIDEMYRKYQAEEVLLSESNRQQRQDDIVSKESQVRDLQKKRFGADGDLFKKRQELVQPTQDKVYKAIEKYAQDRGFDFILERSAGVNILYANPDLDRTEDIMKKLGVN